MILLIGGLGSIGSRYRAILDYLGEKYVVWDTANIETSRIMPVDFDAAIIATPTETHFNYCKVMEALRKPYLCEKPITKNRGMPLINGYSVCNYKYLIEPGQQIHYNYYKTGSDGLLWDCCQLIYLDPNAVLLTTSPRWILLADNQDITYRQLENSYVSMIRDFVKGNYKKLWTIEEGLAMTDAVLERMERDSHSSQNQLEATA